MRLELEIILIHHDDDGDDGTGLHWHADGRAVIEMNMDPDTEQQQQQQSNMHAMQLGIGWASGVVHEMNPIHDAQCWSLCGSNGRYDPALTPCCWFILYHHAWTSHAHGDIWGVQTYESVDAIHDTRWRRVDCGNKQLHGLANVSYQNHSNPLLSQFCAGQALFTFNFFLQRPCLVRKIFGFWLL